MDLEATYARLSLGKASNLIYNHEKADFKQFFFVIDIISTINNELRFIELQYSV